jgi:predicted O-methyltransferase YrrM
VEEYQFKSDDWAEPFRENVKNLFFSMANKPLNYLEVGVFEGRSACYMLDNVLTHPDSRATLIDCKVQENGWNNLQRHHDRIRVYEGDSRVVLPKLSEKFDIIYIDGDHSARGALFDSVLCWLLLKPGGYMLWDDYRLGLDGCNVEVGVKAFLSCIPKSEYIVLLENAQYCVKSKLV